MRRGRFGSAACLALLTAAVVAAEGPRPYPIPMRIEGYVGTKPEHVKSLARWVIAIDGAPYPFHVTFLQPVGVDIAYWNILNQLEPLPITMSLYGAPDLLQRFKYTAPGQPVRLFGNFEFAPGPVTMLLASVEPLPTPTVPVPSATVTAPATT